MGNRPLLTICYFGRNDDYFGDYKSRLTGSLNFLCRGLDGLGRLEATQIILSDWGSEIPLARALELSPSAQRKVEFLYIPPQLARRIHDDPMLPATLALNAAFRRANGEYIATLDADILLTQSSLRGLFDVLERRVSRLEPERVLWFANRRQLPANIVNRRLSPLEMEEYLERNLAYLKCETMGNGYGAGALYLMHREIVHASHGFDERMRWWGWSDTDFALRCNQRYPTVELNNFGVLAVHQEPSPAHMLDEQRHKTSRRFNLPDCNPSFTLNDETWGLAAERLEFMQARVESGGLAPDRTSRVGGTEPWAMTREELTRQIQGPENDRRIEPILKFIPQFMRFDARETNALKTLAWFAATQGVVTYAELGMQYPHAACCVVHNAHGAEVHGLHAFFNRGPGPESGQPVVNCNYFQTTTIQCVDALRLVGSPMGYVRFTGGDPNAAVTNLSRSSAGRFAYDLALIRSGPASPYAPEQGVQLARYVRPGGAIVVYGDSSEAFRRQFSALAEANPHFLKSLWSDGQTGLLLAATLAG